MRPYSIRSAYVPWAVASAPAVVMLGWVTFADAAHDGGGTVVKLVLSAVALIVLVLAVATTKVGFAVLGSVILIALFPFMSHVPGATIVQIIVTVLLVMVLMVVHRRRRRRNGRAWIEFTQRAESVGHTCFVIGYAKPNGAQTSVNGHYLNQPTQSSRNTSVWGRVPAGVTVAMDAGRRVEGWIPTSFSHDAAAAERYRWRWW